MNTNARPIIYLQKEEFTVVFVRLIKAIGGLVASLGRKEALACKAPSGQGEPLSNGLGLASGIGRPHWKEGRGPRELHD